VAAFIGFFSAVRIYSIVTEHPVSKPLFGHAYRASWETSSGVGAQDFLPITELGVMIRGVFRMKRSLLISVARGDALKVKADVLALKYADSLHGVDSAVFERLQEHGLQTRLPKLAGFTLRGTEDCIGAKHVLFVGVKTLREFGYSEIREFASKVLASLAGKAPDIAHVALTIHGPGYGLDEIEAFESELAGIVDAVTSGKFPQALQRITFIESNDGRARRLSAALKKLLPNGSLPVDGRGSISVLEDDVQNTLRTAGNLSASKPHVFVAMSFAEEMDDVFHYGIQGAVNAAGLLCERADLSAFTGDVMDWVKRRISSATLVVADLSSANPNVYLEVGYAWGCRIPTVLLARDTNDLKFDVKSQRCILYKSIKSLEESLHGELLGLSKSSSAADL
jgi:hypothetical protein